jgi:hypothetical protein
MIRIQDSSSHSCRSHSRVIHSVVRSSFGMLWLSACCGVTSHRTLRRISYLCRCCSYHHTQMAYTSCQRRNYSHGIVSLSFLYVIILLSQRRWLRQSRVTYSCIASHAQLLGNMYYYCPLGLLGFWAFGASVMAMIQSTSGLKLFTSAFCGRSSLTALLDDFDDFPYLLHERKSRLLAYAYLR